MFRGLKMEVFSLSNGIRVVFEKIEYIKSITVGVFVGAGSVFETKQESGISHFLEHMFFKGTLKRNAKQIAEFMDSFGGQLNAVTSKEYTCFYAKVLNDHAEKAFDILSDMLLNSTFTQENIELERKVICEEIKIGEDTPEDLIFDMISEKIWGDTALGRPIAGTCKSVLGISRENILDYYHRKYKGDNIVISVVGNYDYNVLKNMLENYFGNGFEGAYNSIVTPYIEVKSGQIIREKEIEQCQLCLAFEGFSRTDSMIYDLLAVNSAFGGSMSSRLFQRIREENGLSYSVYSYLNSYIRQGSLVIYAGMNPLELEKVLALINQEICKLKKDKLSKKEIQFAVEQIRSGIIMGLESMSQRMTTYGKKLLMENKVEDINDILYKISKINEENIEASIERVFDESKLNVAVLGDVKTKDYMSFFNF